MLVSNPLNIIALIHDQVFCRTMVPAYIPYMNAITYGNGIELNFKLWKIPKELSRANVQLKTLREHIIEALSANRGKWIKLGATSKILPLFLFYFYKRQKNILLIRALAWPHIKDPTTIPNMVR